jgi:YHS domain-containing protein
MVMSATRRVKGRPVLLTLLVSAACVLSLGSFSHARDVMPPTLPSASAVALASAAGEAYALAQGAPQQSCPITGEKIDKSVYVDYQGKRVYFCCAACKPAFLKEPGKYLKEMADKGVVLEPSPATEPKAAPEQSSGQGGQGASAGHLGQRGY